MTNYVTARGVQSFSITIASGSTTGTATINSVGAGAFILFGGDNPSTAANPALCAARVTLTDSTTVTATRNTGTSGTVVIKGCVIDGDTSNLVASVQYGTVTIAAGSATGTATISAVTNTNAAVHYLGWSSTNTTLSAINDFSRLSLSNTTVTATRIGTTGAVTVGFVVIEFQPSALAQSVQNVSATSSSSVTSWTATINSVTTTRAMTLFAGHTIATSTTNLAQSKQRGALTAATTFTAYANMATAYQKYYNCSVIEFAPAVLNSSIQRGNTTLTAVTSNTTTLASIDEANTAVSWLGNTATQTTAYLNRTNTAAALTTQTIGGASLIASNGAWDNAVTTISVSISSVSAGDLIVVAIGERNNSTSNLVSISDNKGQIYTRVTSASSSESLSSNKSNLSIWYKQNSVSGVTSVTATFSSTAWPDCEVFVVSGMETVNDVVDTTSSLSNGYISSSSTIISEPISTSGRSFILSIVSWSNYYNNVIGANSPYTYLSSGSVYGAYYITSSAVTDSSCTYNLNGSADTYYCVSTVAFKVAPETTTDVIQVTKHTSNANATASWEVLEFPAYIAGGGGFTMAVSAGAFQLAGQGAILSSSRHITASYASFTTSGYAAALRRGYRLIAAAGSYALTGVASAFRRAVRMAAGTGSFALTGFAANMGKLAQYVLQATSRTFALTGGGVTFRRAFAALAASAGAFALSGKAALFKRAFAPLAAASRVFALSGSATTFRRAFAKLTASVGSFALSGKAALFKRSFAALVAATGSFTLTGFAANLGKFSQYVLAAAAGAFALTGKSALFRRAFAPLVATSRAFALTLRAATLHKAFKALTAAAGSFQLTGRAAVLRRAFAPLVAASAQFVVTRMNAAFKRAFAKLVAGTGSFQVNGQSTVLTRAIAALQAASAQFNATGQAAGLSRGFAALQALAGVFTLSGLNTALVYFRYVVVGHNLKRCVKCGAARTVGRGAKRDVATHATRAVASHGAKRSVTTFARRSL